MKKLLSSTLLFVTPFFCFSQQMSISELIFQINCPNQLKCIQTYAISKNFKFAESGKWKSEEKFKDTNNPTLQSPSILFHQEKDIIELFTPSWEQYKKWDAELKTSNFNYQRIIPVTQGKLKLYYSNIYPDISVSLGIINYNYNNKEMVSFRIEITKSKEIEKYNTKIAKSNDRRDEALPIYAKKLGSNSLEIKSETNVSTIVVSKGNKNVNSQSLIPIMDLENLLSKSDIQIKNSLLTEFSYKILGTNSYYKTDNLNAKLPLTTLNILDDSKGRKTLILKIHVKNKDTTSDAYKTASESFLKYRLELSNNYLNESEIFNFEKNNDEIFSSNSHVIALNNDITVYNYFSIIIRKSTEEDKRNKEINLRLIESKSKLKGGKREIEKIKETNEVPIKMTDEQLEKALKGGFDEKRKLREFSVGILPQKYFGTIKNSNISVACHMELSVDNAEKYYYLKGSSDNKDFFGEWNLKGQYKNGNRYEFEGKIDFGIEGSGFPVGTFAFFSVDVHIGIYGMEGTYKIESNNKNIDTQYGTIKLKNTDQDNTQLKIDMLKKINNDLWKDYSNESDRGKKRGIKLSIDLNANDINRLEKLIKDSRR